MLALLHHHNPHSNLTSFSTGGDAIHNKLKAADVVLPRGSDKSLQFQSNKFDWCDDTCPFIHARHFG